MRNHSKDTEYTVKVSKSPVSGYKCYSVFRNGKLYFSIDGDRVSEFEDEVIENFTLPDFPQYRIYQIGRMVFTGLLPLTEENLDMLPKKCVVYSGMN